MYNIVGIGSFGAGCSGIYTKVFMYTDWIENVVWPTTPNVEVTTKITTPNVEVTTNITTPNVEVTNEITKPKVDEEKGYKNPFTKYLSAYTLQVQY